MAVPSLSRMKERRTGFGHHPYLPDEEAQCLASKGVSLEGRILKSDIKVGELRSCHYRSLADKRPTRGMLANSGDYCCLPHKLKRLGLTSPCQGGVCKRGLPMPQVETDD